MTVRTLTPNDAADWWNLRLQALEGEPFAFGQSAEEHRAMPVETVAERFHGASASYFTVGAFEDGELVGTATFVRERGLKERHKGNVYGFYVAPVARRRGVGKALMTALLEKAGVATSLEQVRLTVSSRMSAAAALYRKFGFVSYGTELRALKIGDEYCDEDHMVLRIR